MSDEDLRELERSAASDELARLRLADALLRQRGPGEALHALEPLAGVPLGRVSRQLDRVLGAGRPRGAVRSWNSFPTAAGLASSASAFAALAAAAAAAGGLRLNAERLSILARQGSGSAARSIVTPPTPGH